MFSVVFTCCPERQQIKHCRHVTYFHSTQNKFIWPLLHKPTRHKYTSNCQIACIEVPLYYLVSAQNALKEICKYSLTLDNLYLI